MISNQNRTINEVIVTTVRQMIYSFVLNHCARCVILGCCLWSLWLQRRA